MAGCLFSVKVVDVALFVRDRYGFDSNILYTISDNRIVDICEIIDYFGITWGKICNDEGIGWIALTDRNVVKI